MAMSSTNKLLLGCGGFLLLAIGSCTTMAVYLFVTADVDASPRIDELFAAMASGKYAETYQNDMTTEFRNVATQEQYEQIGKLVFEALGPLKSKKLVGVNARQNNLTSTIEVTYNATFERGTGTIRAVLQKVEGKWLFNSFHVDSPLLLSAIQQMKCSKCGAKHAPDAKFCPSCGAELTGSKKAEAEPRAEAEKSASRAATTNENESP